MAVRHRDGWIAAGLSALSGLAGLASIPATLWEWDETQFAGALRYYSVSHHAPHPPGFPVYVGLAKLFDLAVRDHRLALGLAGAAFSALLGAGLYRLFREIFEDRAVAVAASLLTILAPATLVYAGAPRSDIAGFAAGVWALALAFRARRSPRGLVPAGLALGLGAGVRVTVIPTAGPALVTAWTARLLARRRKTVLASALAAVLSLAAAYAPAVLLTGASSYLETARMHAANTAATDPITAPNENRFVSLRARRFFVDPWGGRDKAEIVFALAIAGALILAARDRKALGRLALAFGPIIAFTFLLTTPLAGPLYALPCLPFFTGPAAAGLVGGARALGRAVRRPWLGRLGPAAAALLGLMAAAWTWPILAMRRSSPSPPAQAMERVRELAGGGKPDIYADVLFLPHLKYAFPDWTARVWQGDFIPYLNLADPRPTGTRVIFVSKAESAEARGTEFVWPDPTAARRLARLSLGRYGRAFVSDLTTGWNAVWLEGFEPEATDGGRAWRWMGERGRMALFRRAETMRLTLRAAAPPPSLAGGEVRVIIRLDGVEIARFAVAGEEIERSLEVPLRSGGLWSELTLEADRAYETRDSAGIPRRRGLRIFEIDWLPAAGAEPAEYGTDGFIGEGWYPVEPGLRWTKARAEIRLPAVPGDGLLELTCRVQAGPGGRTGRVTLAIDGRVVDEFAGPAAAMTRLVRVPVSIHGGKPTLLVLANDDPVRDATGSVLGICVYYLGWCPAGPGPPSGNGSAALRDP